MFALAVVGVVVSIAVPNLRSFLQNNRLSSVSNDLLASIQSARTEAIKRQSSVVLCATANPTATIPTCSYGGGTSWVVFQDSNGNWQADANEPVIERHPALDSALHFATDGQAAIAFNASGFATPSGTVRPMRNVVICDSRGVATTGTQSTARALIIAVTGRGRVSAVGSEVSTALAATGGTCP